MRTVQTSASRKGRGSGTASRRGRTATPPGIRAEQPLLGVLERLDPRARQPQPPRGRIDEDGGQDDRQAGGRRGNLGGRAVPRRDRPVGPFEELDLRGRARLQPRRLGAGNRWISGNSRSSAAVSPGSQSIVQAYRSESARSCAPPPCRNSSASVQSATARSNAGSASSATARSREATASRLRPSHARPSERLYQAAASDGSSCRQPAEGVGHRREVHRAARVGLTHLEPSVPCGAP